MPLQFSDGRPFATGAAKYTYRLPTNNSVGDKLFVQVKINNIRTEAMVDTGGVFLLCSPEIAERLQLDERQALDDSILNIRGSYVRGKLHRLDLTVLAEEGQSITIEATAFIPEERRPEIWVDDFPCFLGMQGCLERLRFAIDPDPQNEIFYFGAAY